MWLRLFIFLAWNCVATKAQAEKCYPVPGFNSFTKVPILSTKTTGANDHYYIGGLFAVHEKGSTIYKCGKISTRGLQMTEAFLWYIKEYSKAPLNISVGGIVFDSCFWPELAVGNVIGFERCMVRYKNSQITDVSPRNLLAYAGPDQQVDAFSVANLLNSIAKPGVSPIAMADVFGDPEFQFFLRTVPSYSDDVKMILKILNKAAVKYIISVFQDTVDGRLANETLHKFATNVCVVYSAMIPKNTSAVAMNVLIDDLKTRRVVQYIAIFADKPTIRLVLEAADRQSAVGFKFFGTSVWGTSSSSTMKKLKHVTKGSITIFPELPKKYKTLADEFLMYFKTLIPANSSQVELLENYWRNKYKCNNNKNCTAFQKEQVDDAIPNLFLALEAIMAGINTLIHSKCATNSLCSNVMNSNTVGGQIYKAIQETKLAMNGIQQPVFDSSGSLAEGLHQYIVYVIDENGNYVKAGRYDGQYLLLTINLESSKCPDSPCLQCGEKPLITKSTMASTSKSQYSMSSTPDPTEAGKYVFVRVPSDGTITGSFQVKSRKDIEMGTRFNLGFRWVIPLGVLAGLGILAVLIFEIYILYKLLGTKIGRQWRTMWLGQLLLLGILLSYLTLFAYLPIPTKATCGITRFGVGICYAMCFAVLLVKLMVILTSKTNDDYLSNEAEASKYLKGIYQFLMFIFAVGVQLVIDIQWLITTPPEAVKVIDNRGIESWICNHYTWEARSGYMNMTAFVRNEFENHLLSLVYVMFLILITTLVAIRTHGIITNHRESIFVGISAGFAIPLWVAWGLTGGLNKQHPVAHEFGDACIAFGLFLTATLILFTMFLPKVRQMVNMGLEGVYLEDDRETYYGGGGSVIIPTSSYKSRPDSFAYVNGGEIYSEPTNNNNLMALHLKHSGSTYSAPVYTKRSESPFGSTRMLRITRDLTGKTPDRPRSQSEYNYPTSYKPTTSIRGTLKRSHSTQNLGAL